MVSNLFREYRPRTLPPASIITIVSFECVLFLISEFPILRIPLTPILVVLLFRAFAHMHESVHQSGSKVRSINTLLGELFGAMCLMPFIPYKEGHLLHHQWAGNLDMDPVLRSIHRALHSKFYPLINLTWKCWIPLIALSQTLYLWFIPLVRPSNLKAVRSLIIGICFWSLHYLFYLQSVPLGLCIGIFLAFTFLMEWVSFPHHYDVSFLHGKERFPVPEQFYTTRSCHFPDWISEHLFLNFNLHTEHHLFPSLPYPGLKKAKEHLMRQLGHRYKYSTGFEWDLSARTHDILTATGFENAYPQETQEPKKSVAR